MRKMGLKRNSIIVRLLLSMLVVLLIHTLILSANIRYGGTIDELNRNSINLLDEKVLNRKNHVQNEMIQRRSNIAKFEQDIQDEINSFLKEKGTDYAAFKQDSVLMSEFLERVVDEIVFTVRQSAVTGAFIVLDGENKENYPGIYIRDSDPLFNPSDNSDLSMEIGPSAAARKSKIALGMGWKPQFIFDKKDESSFFYYKPFETALMYPYADFSELGYWTHFTLNNYGTKVISYSIPLINKNGSVYGVIGIELDSDYIRKMLYYDEMAANKQGTYLLAITRDNGKTFENVTFSGSSFNKIFKSGTDISLTRKEEYKNIATINTGISNKDTIYGCIHYLDLYDNNTPFKEDKWALLGIVEEKNLFQPAERIRFYVAISLIFSLVLGFIVSILIGIWFIKPITDLVKEVKSSDPEMPITLTKTNIAEIDELARSVELLSTKVAESAAELSKIVGMMEVPICAFEHDLKNDKVLCTDAFFELTGAKREKNESGYISAEYFYKLLDEIRRCPEPDSEDVYCCENGSCGNRWLRIKVQKSDGKILGIIEDATREIMEKKKIEYERDRDLLTHLLNRRAFQAKVIKLLKEKDVKTAALVMWDLDNLKFVNDTYGHDFGDQYIKTAASVLNELSIYNGIVGRMSGDEFYAFIYGYEDKQQIKEIIKRVQNKLCNTILKLPDGKDLNITASTGIAWYPDDSTSYYELLKYADFAMYESKNGEKGSIGEFEKPVYNKKILFFNGKKEINNLIEEKLFDFVFQPIVIAKTGETFAYESLIRSKSAVLISSRAIVTLAGSQSRLYDMERITWFKTLETFKKYEKDFENAKIFINSIPNYILSDKDLAELENKFKTDLSRIVIEITENELTDERVFIKKQSLAKRWGCSLALDDFGSGYNIGIAFLTFYPDFVKLNMAVTRGIDKDINRQNFVRAILQYTKSRKVKLIAEGIETKEEMDTLIQLGADYLQGYYLGRPSLQPKKISPKIVQEILEQSNEHLAEP